MISDLYALIAGVVVLLVGFVGVYLRGRRDAKDKAEKAKLEENAKTRKKTDDAEIHTDVDLATRWLQSRDPDQR